MSAAELLGLVISIALVAYLVGYTLVRPERF